MATPLTVRGIRRLCKSSSSRQKEALLQRAVLRLATKFDIQTFENKGLRKALTQEKKRRQRGKRLNLLGEEEAAVPQFFSPQRVLAAKAYQEGKDEAVEEEKRQRAIRKEEATAKREELQLLKEGAKYNVNCINKPIRSAKQLKRHKKRKKGRKSALKKSRGIKRRPC
jgi:hypothetical protein